MECEHVAAMLERIMTGDAWHGPSVRQVLDGVDAGTAARRPPGEAHGIWELVLHMTGWADEVTARLGGRAAQEPDPGDWPAIGDPTPARWAEATAGLFAAHERLAAAIRRLDDRRLDEPVLDYRDRAMGTGLSHRLTLHGLIQHTVYHSGQISLLRRIQT